MSDLDLDFLEALATASRVDGDDEWYAIADLDNPLNYGDREFVAAVSPRVVLALIGRCRNAEASAQGAIG